MTGKKLFIQVPAYNEEAAIQDVLGGMPKEIEGFATVAVVVINDGSTDNTVRIARRCGIEQVVDLSKNSGLGKAFRKGLEYALANGADVIVNVDADNQYNTQEIEKIIAPILKEGADLVIGDRGLESIPGYPLHKLISQSIGNYLVSGIFHCEVKDATSGFRAITRCAADILVNRLTNDYTYTLESLCVLLAQRMRVAFVPVNIRYPTRSSRLIKSKLYYCLNFLSILFRFLMRTRSKAY